MISMSSSWPLFDSSPTYYTRPRYGYRHYGYGPEYLGSLGAPHSSSLTYYSPLSPTILLSHLLCAPLRRENILRAFRQT